MENNTTVRVLTVGVPIIHWDGRDYRPLIDYLPGVIYVPSQCVRDS